jgi:hypothetical protein
MIESKIGQRLVGLFLAVLGGGATAWSWYTALTWGYYYRKAVVFFPLFAVVGLGILLFPIDRERLRAEYGTAKPQGLAHLPLVWKVLLVLAVLAALGNWYAIAHLVAD